MVLLSLQVADSSSVAMAAALGVAALVPPNGLNPGTLVATASAASSWGLVLTSGVASGTPNLSKRRVIAGPREL